MSKLLLNRGALKSCLTALIATGGPLDAAKVHLYTAPVNPDLHLTIESMPEAAFTGYSAFGPVVWGAPFNTPDGMAVQGADHQFTCTAAPAEEVPIYGFYLTNTDGTVLLGVQPFDEPVAITTVDDAVVVTPYYEMVNAAA